MAVTKKTVTPAAAKEAAAKTEEIKAETKKDGSINSG